MKFMVGLVIMLSIKEIATQNLVDFGECIGTKQYMRTDVNATFSWEYSRGICSGLKMSLASVDSEAERVHLTTLLTGDSNKDRRYWTQGALVAYYPGVTLVNTPFMSVEYPFIGSPEKPLWCLVLGIPVAPNKEVLVAEDCVDSSQNTLCQMENACPLSLN